jgi:hypothetical protein
MLSAAPFVRWVEPYQGLQAIGWDFEVTVRHERAHCNGWHHERAR